uniref:F-box/LRR-repeat protein 15/At3g58940/PEG3-like LRR domain-containing protein n=1 Tax=Aegilops tauschii TaxID=37682 RepID=M8CDX8_AEGTA
MESRHMDFIISKSPVLEILCIQANLLMDRLTLVSRSIRVNYSLLVMESAGMMKMATELN